MLFLITIKMGFLLSLIPSAGEKAVPRSISFPGSSLQEPARTSPFLQYWGRKGEFPARIPTILLGKFKKEILFVPDLSGIVVTVKEMLSLLLLLQGAEALPYQSNPNSALGLSRELKGTEGNGK